MAVCECLWGGDTRALKHGRGRGRGRVKRLRARCYVRGVQFGILGPLVVWRDGREVPIGAAKQRALLTLLLLRRGELVTTETLLDGLWGERPPATGVKVVQVYVSQLRKVLGEGLLETRPAGYMLRLESGVLDAERFEGLLERARGLLTDGDAPAAGEILREGLALWRGPPLAEFRYEAFARDDISRLRRAAPGCARAPALESDLALGRHTEAVPELETLVREHPLRESLRGLLMLALYRAGRQADALAVYQEARAALLEELGLDPGHSLQRLEKAILQQDPALDLRRPATTPRRWSRSGCRRPAPVRAARRELEGRHGCLRRSRRVHPRRAEVMDPEDVAALLDPYHAALKGELERFGGTVEKFIGDAVMAIFGAPATREDDAERAVRAALAIRDWAAEARIELRVGISTGEALVTLEARPAEGEAMAAGDVVNTAARLQAAAPLGGILAGEQTVAATGTAIEFGDEVAVDAKGKTRLVRAWPVLRARARSIVDRVDGAALVGRRREIELLTGALDRARQERSPELLTLVGVPGIGKSRLVLELYAGIERDAELISWRSGRCLAYGEGITFWALGEMVKSEAGILEGDSPEEAERKLRAVVDDPWVESHLRPLVGLTAAAEGGGRREEAFTAWRRIYERLDERRPLVLVFEDLHWADDDLLDFVDHLTDWATGVPLLVVCTARPELLSRRPGWGGGKLNALTVSLSPLSDDDTSRLLGELLEGSRLSDDQQAELLARAGGNPLYAEEFARTLREQGRIERLPETVQGLIAARLDLLEADQKEIVQNAAVVGKTFWLSTLALLDGLDEGALEQRLHALERKEFVRRERSSSVAGDAEYSFRHVLVRDVAYGQIPRAERASKHLQTANWIEQLGRPEDHSEMLAHHYLQALELGAATGFDIESFAESARAAFADAGDRASALNAPAAAVRYYRAALDLLREDDPSRNRILLKLGYSLWLIGEPSTDVLRRASEGMEATGDAEGAGEAEMRLAEHSWLDDDRGAAVEHLDHALTLLGPLQPSRVKVHQRSAPASRPGCWPPTMRRPFRLGWRRSRWPSSLDLTRMSRRQCFTNLGTARLNLGDARGLDDLTEAIRVAGAANAPFELCRAKGNLAAYLWVDGKLAESVDCWEDTRTDAARYGQLSFQRWVAGALLVPYYMLGRWDELAEKADAFIAEVEAGRPHYLASQAYSSRALCRFSRGEDAEALADCELALSAAKRAGDNQALLPTLARLAHIRLALGDHAGAADAAGTFLDAVKAGRPGFAASSLHELAWTLAALGRGQELADAISGRSDAWSRAATAYAQADPVSAADVMGGIGACAEEAYARLAAGRLLIAQGRYADADDQLGQALAFHKSVRAARYVEEAETLRASPN